VAAVFLRNVSKRFGSVPVLDGVSLDVSDGEFLSILGPSGCGKSTLLRVIAGLETQDSGTVSIGGRIVNGLRPKKRDVAVVFQSYALYPQMTALENMMLPLVMRHLSFWQRLPLIGPLIGDARHKRATLSREVCALAETLGLGHLLHRKPAQLSGGQRQRVAVGRAMVRQPSVFLMDEPLSNLDAKLRVQMRAEIVALHRKLRTTFIYVTHDQSEAMTMSDRVAVMLDGKVQQLASPQELYSRPAKRQVAEFIGSPRINLLAGTVARDGTIEAAGTKVAMPSSLPAGTAVTLGIRPEALTFADHTELAMMTGRVRLIEHLGADVFVHLDVPGQAEAVIARAKPEYGTRLRTDQVANLLVSEPPLLFDSAGDRLASDHHISSSLRFHAGAR
jgi:multiple sugar transport system ATP-binding protein